MADTAAPLPAFAQPLVAAGKTLAALAEPHHDLLSFGDDFREIATTLKHIGEEIDRACESAEARYDRIVDGKAKTLDLDLMRILDSPALRGPYAERVRAGDLADARSMAARKAKRALIDLVALIAEIEAQPTEAE